MRPQHRSLQICICTSSLRHTYTRAQYLPFSQHSSKKAITCMHLCTGLCLYHPTSSLYSHYSSFNTSHLPFLPSQLHACRKPGRLPLSDAHWSHLKPEVHNVFPSHCSLQTCLCTHVRVCVCVCGCGGGGLSLYLYLHCSGYILFLIIYMPHIKHPLLTFTVKHALRMHRTARMSSSSILTHVHSTTHIHLFPLLSSTPCQTTPGSGTQTLTGAPCSHRYIIHCSHSHVHSLPSLHCYYYSLHIHTATHLLGFTVTLAYTTGN